MQTIYLDISNKGVVPTIYAKQGDVGRKFAAILTDSGVPYQPESGDVFSLWYSGESGDGNYTEINSNRAVSVDKNKIVVELISQMLKNAGNGTLSLILNDPYGHQIGFWNINYFVEPIPGSESGPAQSYYTAFSKSASDVIDATSKFSFPVSVEFGGTGADNPVDARKNIGAAPDGYGLGNYAYYAKSLTNANDGTEIGWYVLEEDAINGVGVRAMLRVDAYSVTSLIQTAFSTHYSQIHPLIMQRSCVNGVWGEWEWPNPPMLSGIEYRTTERWLGKTVYQKYVPIGAVSAGENLLPHGISGFTGCIGIRLTDGNNNDVTQHPNVNGLYVTSDGIHVVVGEAQTLNATLKYTKS